MVAALVGMVVLVVGEADRIENQMVVNMPLVDMGSKYKLVLTTQYFFCQLHPNLMGFLGGDLPRLKGLDQVAAQVRALVDGMAACPFKFNVGDVYKRQVFTIVSICKSAFCLLGSINLT